MEATKRSVGRPKGSPQTGPLVLSERCTRTKLEVELGAEFAQELGEYVRWIQETGGLSRSDAMAATVEFAFGSLFKRDRLWKEQRRRGEAQEPPARRAAPEPTPTPPSSLPPSVPRPLPTTPPRPNGDRSGIPVPGRSP
jgi:hypothetical protein